MLQIALLPSPPLSFSLSKVQKNAKGVICHHVYHGSRSFREAEARENIFQ